MDANGHASYSGLFKSTKRVVHALPIGINEAYRFSHGHMYMTKKARKFKEDLRAQVQGKLKGPMIFCMRFYPKNKIKRDLDNLIKLTLDAMCTGEDDSLVKIIWCEKCDCKKHVCLEAVLKEL